jgi:hypothetical protein
MNMTCAWGCPHTPCMHRLFFLPLLCRTTIPPCFLNSIEFMIKYGIFEYSVFSCAMYSIDAVCSNGALLFFYTSERDSIYCRRLKINKLFLDVFENMLTCWIFLRICWLVGFSWEKMIIVYFLRICWLVGLFWISWLVILSWEKMIIVYFLRICWLVGFSWEKMIILYFPGIWEKM